MVLSRKATVEASFAKLFGKLTFLDRIDSYGFISKTY